MRSRVVEEEKLSAIMVEVGNEVRRAVQLHPSYNSAHEAYADILEELEEFWEQVKLKKERRNPDEMKKELIQTACTCVRSIIDLEL